MAAEALQTADLPVIEVEEHRDKRRHPRFWPPGMIGYIRFKTDSQKSHEYHFIGLNLSRSGAAVVIANEGDPLPSARGKISIFLRQTRLYNQPFRVTRTRQIGRYLEIGLQFQHGLFPLQAIQHVEVECLKNGLADLADPKSHEMLTYINQT